MRKVGCVKMIGGRAENRTPRCLWIWQPIVFCLLVTAASRGDIIRVDKDSPADYQDIQAGIDAATDGDVVLVASGEYVVTAPITFRGKPITLRSEAGSDNTTIRMGTPTDTKRASVVVFENDETLASILEGFTLTGGRGCRVSAPWPAASGSGGGGILCLAASPTIVACTITQNSADDGGGVNPNYGSSPSLTHCIISENSASGSGGGVSCWDESALTMTDCIIRENSAPGTTMYVNGNGGGIFCGQRSELRMTGCDISENSAGINGGGISCQFNSVLTMTNCSVTNNTSRRWSAGIGSGHCSMTLTNCIIAENTADMYCGGVEAGFQDSSLSIRNCTVFGNSAGQDGGGVYCWDGASLTVTSSIFRDNTASRGREFFLQKSPSKLSISHSNVAGGQTGVHIGGGSTLEWGADNINADPCFVSRGSWWDQNDTPRNASDDIWLDADYHLKSQAGRWDPNTQSWVQDDITSPCIDAGDPMSPIGPETFPNGGFVNMGAYGGTPEASKSYFGEPICGSIIAGDINGDCQVNRADLEIMALHWTDPEPMQP